MFKSKEMFNRTAKFLIYQQLELKFVQLWPFIVKYISIMYCVQALKSKIKWIIFLIEFETVNSRTYDPWIDKIKNCRKRRV